MMERPRHRILIVDDQPTNIKILGAALRSDYDIVIATGGSKALEIARSEELDLILLDVMMPGMDGYEVFRFLKKGERTKDIPVIFVTAMSEVHDEVKGFELGAVDYIIKPFKLPVVRARVKTHLELKWKSDLIEFQKDELLEKQRIIDEDLHVAAGIQQSLLPRKFPQVNNVRFAHKFQPCEAIGGDIFDVITINERYICLYILDVSGHGVSSALVTVSVSQMMHPHSGLILTTRENEQAILHPAEVLKLLDEEYPMDRFGKYFTMVYLVLDRLKGSLAYSNAAHPRPILIRSGGELEPLEEGGTIIGLEGVVPFDGGEVRLISGDKVILYTDGVTEHRREDGELFGEERLFDLLKTSSDLRISGLVDTVFDTVIDFGGPNKPEDDITIVGFEYGVDF
jgi:sigma-B regulation protein RsbU (phosphoserine phosphatase)